MSIDATIIATRWEGRDLWLELGPRIGDDERLSTPGQARLRIVRPTYVPEPGTDIWGGDSLVELCSTPKRIYHREGYVTLREATQVRKA